MLAEAELDAVAVCMPNESRAPDVMLYLMGNPKPTSVFGTRYAQFGPDDNGMSNWGTSVSSGASGVEDLAAAMVRIENGATWVLEASWVQHIQEERLYSEVYGDKAALAWCRPMFADQPGCSPDIVPYAEAREGHEAETIHFVDCIVNDRQSLATVDQALDVM